MNQDVVNSLSSIPENSVLFFNYSPEIIDFTDKSLSRINILVQTKDLTKEIIVRLDNDEINYLISLLKISVFNKTNKVICWNWKNFSSFLKNKTGKLFLPECSLVDLKVIETYLGKRNKCPENISQALLRLKSLVQTGEWKDIESVYKNIYYPLMTKVLPSLENTYILNDVSRLFPYYEINGQDNGRLKCSKYFNDGYVPHTISEKDKNIIKSRDGDEIFLSFDFKGMEVFVLAKLSNDPLLMDCCKTKDVYTAIADKIFEENFEKKSREFAKKVFLPVIYGQTAYSLSCVCEISLQLAEKIYNKIYNLFSPSIKFVESYQTNLKQLGYAKDVFGKKRYNFEEGKDYVVRNFSIQSPSSLICLEMLNNLYFSIEGKAEIVYTVHDGYVVYATKENWKNICKICYSSLTQESVLCPGLQLKVTCCAGTKLNNLKLLNK